MTGLGDRELDALTLPNGTKIAVGTEIYAREIIMRDDVQLFSPAEIRTVERIHHDAPAGHGSDRDHRSPGLGTPAIDFGEGGHPGTNAVFHFDEVTERVESGEWVVVDSGRP